VETEINLAGFQPSFATKIAQTTSDQVKDPLNEEFLDYSIYKKKMMISLSFKFSF